MILSARQPLAAPAPGIYHDVPAVTYFGWAAVSASLLKEMDRSAAHGRAWLDGAEEPPSDALAFGSAYHCFALEQAEFAKRYTVVEKFPRRSNADKARWEALTTEAGGERFVMWTSERDKMTPMRDALLSHPSARALIETPGRFEVSIVWTDEATGLTCKARIDRLARMSGLGWTLLDLKTAEDARIRPFDNAVASYGYDVQAGWYTRGFAAATGRTLPFVFVVQEKEPPYAVAVRSMEQAEIQAGDALAGVALLRLADALKSNNWPAYGDQPIPVALPIWRYQQAEQAMEGSR